jgi:hypothetical protein
MGESSMPARRPPQTRPLPHSDAATIFSAIAVAAAVLVVIALNQRAAPRLTPIVYIPQGAVSDATQSLAPQVERTSLSRIDLSFADINNNFAGIGIRNTILQ